MKKLVLAISMLSTPAFAQDRCEEIEIVRDGYVNSVALALSLSEICEKVETPTCAALSDGLEVVVSETEDVATGIASLWREHCQG